MEVRFRDGCEILFFDDEFAFVRATVEALFDFVAEQMKRIRIHFKMLFEAAKPEANVSITC